MAVPGFSITELIQAAAKTKEMYDAFFHKYDNASSRVRHLRDMVQLFQLNLSSHQWLLEQSGHTYPGLDAFNRTLCECTDFIEKYKRLLEGSRFRPRDAVATISWTFEDKHISNILRQLQLHIEALNGFTLTLLLKNAIEQNHSAAPKHHSRPLSVDIDGISTQPLLHQIERTQLSALAENLRLDAPQPRPLMVEGSESAEALVGLWHQVQLYSNRQKRLQSHYIQSGRVLPTSGHSRRASVQNEAHQELQIVIEKWKAIARANGVDETHLPTISAEQPLETAEEFCRRVLQASELASQPRTSLSPLVPSPDIEPSSWLNSPNIRPQPVEMASSITPNDSLWTQHSIDSTTPLSLRGIPSSCGLDELDLPPPNVLDCHAKLNMTSKENKTNRTRTYPTLELMRMEFQQVHGSSEIFILCTTTKNIQVRHKLPRGTRTHPYTKHKSLNKPREVSFLEKHQLIHGTNIWTGDLTYTFFSDADCTTFLNSIRGKQLVYTWDVDKVAFRTSDQLGEATDQHLKIWREFDGGNLSISFFANNPSDGRSGRHREFLLSRLNQATPDKKRRAGGIVRLEFRPARRPSMIGSSSWGLGLGLGNLTVAPMSSSPPSAGSASPTIGTSTARVSPIVPQASDANGHSHTPARSPTIASHGRRSSTNRQSVGRAPTVQTLSTSATIDDPEADSVITTDEEGNRLKWIDITFTDIEDAEKFERLLPQIQHI